MLELLSDWVDNLSLRVGGRARAPSSGRSDKRYLEGQIFLRLDSSPLPAIRPDSPVCDTSDSECDSVSLGPSQPSYQCVLPASACTPSLRMKHSFFFFLQNFSLCVHTPGEDVRAKRICGVSIARFNARTKASSVASAWCRRAAACGEPPHCCASCSPDSS